MPQPEPGRLFPAVTCQAFLVPTPTIRPAATADLPVLQDIETAAGQRYRDVGLDRVAQDDPFPIDVLQAYADAGRAWVAVDRAEGPVGYILVDLIDGGAHIEQVSVTPRFQSQGIGRALVDRVRRWAEANGLAALTLTTFDEVPWNRPLYEHLGFRVAGASEVGPGLQRIRALEASHGLNPDQRVVMCLDVHATTRKR
jgi:GNAT superfamily N-acetyltransferase